MNSYIGTKIIQAAPMNRAAYNAYRGWELPSNENGDDEGYLVEYLDGGKPNHPEHAGYISWSPKAQFEIAYIDIGDTTGLPPHILRVVGEWAELEDRRTKLFSFMHTKQFEELCDEAERTRMIDQHSAMSIYASILLQRIKAATAKKLIGLPVKGEVS